MSWFIMVRRYAAAMALAMGTAVIPAIGTAQGVSPFGEATPVATAAPGWEIADIREIEVDGMPVALSPDGQWIAGTGPDWELCVWEIETLNPVCAEPGYYRPNAEAIVWSPDSTAVAFTEDAARLLVDSDLYVFELGTGVLSNLTDDDFVGPLMLTQEESEPDEVLVDLGPTWSPDGQTISFGRMFWTVENRGAKQPQILRIGRSGGKPEVLAELTTLSPWGVIYPMVELEGGRLVFSIATANPNNPNEGVWMLEPCKEPVEIVSGSGLDDFPSAQALDATVAPDGVLISGWSMPLATAGIGLDPYAFLVNADTGELDTLDPAMTPLRFGPDGLSTIALVVEENDGMLTITTPNGDVSSMGPVPRSRFEQTRGLDWASNNTVFIASGVSSGQLVTLAPVEG